MGPFDAWSAGKGDIADFGWDMEKKFRAEHPENPGGYGNAARHLAWQAKLTQRFGAEKAAQIGAFHELGDEDTTDSIIDQHNNIIGREIGKNSTTDKEIEDAIREALKEGRPIVDETDPRLGGRPKNACGDSSDGSSDDSSESPWNPLYPGNS